MSTASTQTARSRVPEGRKLRPANRRRMSEDVAAQITEFVITNGLKPGDRLPTEPELVEKFDVSRTVVREAGRLLVERGLVDIRPGRGMSVASFDGAAISRQYQLMLELGGGSFTELMELRMVLEAGMTAFAARRRTEDDLATMDQSLAAFAATMDVRTKAAEAHPAAVEADLAFHAAVAAAAHNPFFLHVVNPINDYLRQTYLNSLGYHSSQAQTHAEHTLIADAIRDGDAERARRVARQHLARIIAESDQLTDQTSPARPTPRTG